MSTPGGGGSGGGVGGALSLMGCVREASPPPQDFSNFGEFSAQANSDTLPKEPKRRRFHPLRGLRKIFRRKSRGAADVRITSATAEGCEMSSRDREEVTLRHPAGRPEEARSRSASELLTDSCDRGSVFLRRGAVEDSVTKLRSGGGQLSVSHDSVFPGEVSHTRPLSSLDSLSTLERRQLKMVEGEHKESSSHVVQRHRISLQVLEQIKTVIESRNQVASTTSTETTVVHSGTERYQQETAENLIASIGKNDKTAEEPEVKVSRYSKETNEQTSSLPKEDLPSLEIGSLNHTAAHHRIWVRPKNRRPPKRSSSKNASKSDVPSIPEASDVLDSLEEASSGVSTPVESRNISITRQPSSRLSRNSELFEELESKLPRKPIARIFSKSPDVLDPSGILFKVTDSPDADDQQPEPKPVTRRSSSRISKGSDIFEELEAKLPRRRSSTNRLSKSPDSLESTWFSKSTDSFDKLDESEEARDPIILLRRPPNPISKSVDRVSKSSDSLEGVDAVVSDDSIERRRSSYEFRVPRRSSKTISKSSENFEVAEEVQSPNAKVEFEVQKRNSASDLVMLRGRTSSRMMSKSSESFDRVEFEGTEQESKRSSSELGKSSWKPTKRMAGSSESSDNLELDDELENRRARRPSKRISGTGIVDVVPADDAEEERKVTPVRKPSRLQKSSESSELGSTDTVDSDRKNKSSDSTETVDSLEKDQELEQEKEQDRKEEETTESVVELRRKNDAWPTSTEVDVEDTKALLNDKSYWRQSSESKENIDIHQLLAITIVTRMSDNGNQRGSVKFPKKKLSPQTPSSPVKQEDNKLLFNNLLTSKNDEDLQNMLNGNISEVSTDTKSFKEKLIMFEKLGK